MQYDIHLEEKGKRSDLFQTDDKLIGHYFLKMELRFASMKILSSLNIHSLDRNNMRNLLQLLSP